MSGKCTYWMTLHHPKVTAVALINNNLLVCTIKKPLPTTTLSSYIPLVMLISWFDYGEVLLETFLVNFYFKFRMVFFMVRHSIGHSSGMVSLIDMKQKRGTSFGYWANYVTLTSGLTHDLHLRFFKVGKRFQTKCQIVQNLSQNIINPVPLSTIGWILTESRFGIKKIDGTSSIYV